MKKLLLLALLSMIFTACKKEDEKTSTEYLPPAVDLFQAQYNEGSKEISLTWRYGSSSQISHFELFYSPGQDSVEKLDPWACSYTLYPASSNTNYLFNIRVIDLYGTYSEARVVYIFTETEE